jgi:hypothetical protein
MAERPKGYVSHQTPHRVRVRVPGKRRNRTYFADLRDHLLRVPNVERVDVNPATASVLVHTRTSSHLLEMARQSELLDLEEAFAEESSSLLERAGLKVDYIEEQLKQLSGGQLDLRNAVFLALIVAALHQILRGNIFHAPAATLLWYATRIMQTSRAAEGAP